MNPSYIFGKNSVLSLLENHPEQVTKIFVAEGLNPDKRLNRIFDLAKSHNISYQKAPRSKLDSLVRETAEQQPNTNHQGVVALTQEKPLWTLEALLALCKRKQEEGLYPKVLLLDEITEAGNLGAILRVADAGGLDGVIIPKHRSATLNPIVSKASAGADQVVPIVQVTNLVQAIETLKSAGFWIVGATLEGKSIPYHEQDFLMPVALVMGNEGKGLRRLVSENCDFWVKIPMLGTVSSLNVACATAILTFEIVRQQLSRQNIKK